MPLRCDMLFGASFVLFRILWDFCLTHEYVVNRPETQIVTKVILIFKSVMNFKFFIDWIKQQIRLWKRKPLSLKAASALDGTCSPMEAIKAWSTERSVLAATPLESDGRSVTTLVYHQQSQEKKMEQLLQQSKVSSSTFPLTATKNRRTKTMPGVLVEEPRVELVAVH